MHIAVFFMSQTFTNCLKVQIDSARSAFYKANVRFLPTLSNVRSHKVIPFGRKCIYFVLSAGESRPVLRLRQGFSARKLLAVVLFDICTTKITIA
jgi:hypothetical protein